MADEALELRPSLGRGRPITKLLRAELGKPLTEADLLSLETQGSLAVIPPSVVNLRDSHHRLARCLAAGLTHSQASAQTGYSMARIRMLVVDPSFKDLIKVYRNENNEEYLSFQSLATANMVKAERIVSDSLEAVAERETPLAPSELRPILEIAGGRMDRFGYPAHSVGHNVNHDLAGKLKSARQRSGLVEQKAPLLLDVPKEEPVSDES